MCGRFAQSMAGRELGAHLDRHYRELHPQWEPGHDQERYRPRFNVPPRSNNVIVRQQQTQNGNVQNTLSVAQWGLIPHWTKADPGFSGALNTINARSESLTGEEPTSTLWSSIKNKRCVIPVQGFYEWLNKGGTKLPHYIRNPSPSSSNSPDSNASETEAPCLMMAGLWDSVTYEGSDQPIYTFTILTTSSSPRLSFLHQRMPVLLRSTSDMLEWLNCSKEEWRSSLARLLKPFGKDDSDLLCYQVPQEVGKVGQEDESFTKPVANRKGGIEEMFGKQFKAGASDVTSTSNSTTKPLKPSGPFETTVTKKRKQEADGHGDVEKSGQTTVVLSDEDDEVVVLDEPTKTTPKSSKKAKTSASGPTSSSSRASSVSKPKPSAKVAKDQNQITSFFKRADE